MARDRHCGECGLIGGEKGEWGAGGAGVLTDNQLPVARYPEMAKKL